MIESDGRRLAFTVRGEPLAICRLDPDPAIPAEILRAPVVSVTRIGSELSIVCPEDAVPEGALAARGWRCLSVEGPFELATTVGVLATIAGTLAEAGISLFAISTYDTDYILVRHDRLDEAVAALRRAGHIVRDDRST